MANWNGYRASKAAGGGALNGYVTPKAKQEWARGEVVSVGFVRDLYIEGKEGASWLLHSLTSGRKYVFTPHVGLEVA